MRIDAPEIWFNNVAKVDVSSIEYLGNPKSFVRRITVSDPDGVVLGVITCHGLVPVGFVHGRSKADGEVSERALDAVRRLVGQVPTPDLEAGRRAVLRMP